MATQQPWYKILYVQVLIGIVLGVLLGWLAPSIATNEWIDFLGRAFVKLIKMAIAPIIFCTIVSGIAHVQEAKSVGRVGVKALVYFELVSTLALLIGLAVGLLWQPGASFPVQELTPAEAATVKCYVDTARQADAGRLYPAHHPRQRRRRLRQFARGRPLPARRRAGVPDRRHPAGAVLRGAVRLRADEARRARPCAARPDRRCRARDVRGHRHHHEGRADRRLRRDGVHDRQVRPLGARQPSEPHPHLLRHLGPVRARSCSARSRAWRASRS